MTAVGLLTIGQSPRLDLSAPLHALRPAHRFIEAGALDRLTETDLPTSRGCYPLKTRLRDGSLVTVDLAALEPLLQDALDDLEDQGVATTVLMCAGTFAGLKGQRPLLKPFSLVQTVLHSLDIHCIGVICPFAEQEDAIRRRWTDAGFHALVGTAELADGPSVGGLVSAWSEAPTPAECLVLDYFGHDPTQVRLIQERHQAPVFDLGLTTMAILAGILPEN